MAVSLIDRYLSYRPAECDTCRPYRGRYLLSYALLLRQVARKRLQLCGVAAMFIASKFEELGSVLDSFLIVHYHFDLFVNRCDVHYNLILKSSYE